MILGGFGAIYIWTTLNELLKGNASLMAVALSVVILLLLIGLIVGLLKIIGRMEEPL